MSKYTYQLFIAGYAAPSGADVGHADRLTDIGRALIKTHLAAERVGAGYGTSEALYWKGHFVNVTDRYPDGRAFTGPRTGLNWGRS